MNTDSMTLGNTTTADHLILKSSQQFGATPLILTRDGIIAKFPDVALKVRSILLSTAEEEDKGSFY